MVPLNRGSVVGVRGSVVDARFTDRLPELYHLLRAGEEGEVAVEVLSQESAEVVRGIALSPVRGIARGSPDVDTGGPWRSASVRSSWAGCSTSPASRSTERGTSDFGSDARSHGRRAAHREAHARARFR